MKNAKHSYQTRIAQALGYHDERTGALTPNIQLSSTYARDENYDLRKPYSYRRYGNETTELSEAVIADLEEGDACLAFASGNSAAAAVINALPKNAHVLVQEVVYHGVKLLFQDAARKGAISLAFFNSGDLDDLAAKVNEETALVWIETPNNPDWVVTDISTAAQIAHAKGAKLVVDSTVNPPPYTRTLELGADISFHSATKYLGGHSDVTAGVLSTKAPDAFWQDIETQRQIHGTILQSFDAYLLIRGMRTLHLRYERICENAALIAEFLKDDPRLAHFSYPGVESHPRHEIAKRQTGGYFGGMMSFIPKGEQEACAIDICRTTRVFFPATSLGGVESLIEHRLSVTPEGIACHPALIRLSVGIENVEDLIADLDQALEKNVPKE